MKNLTFINTAKAGFDFKPGVLIGLAMVAIDSTIVGLLAISAMKWSCFESAVHRLYCAWVKHEWAVSHLYSPAWGGVVHEGTTWPFSQV